MHIDFGSNPYHKALNASQNETPIDLENTVEAWWTQTHNAVSATPEREMKHELECAQKRDTLQHLRKKQTSGVSGILCGLAHFLYEHVAA
jgi:hypothetical protein